MDGAFGATALGAPLPLKEWPAADLDNCLYIYTARFCVELFKIHRNRVTELPLIQNGSSYFLAVCYVALQFYFCTARCYVQCFERV